MKLKALLLGSAAAMIAVTGANAADAVIAEPEPVEYVRVCDLYGAKWFYLPGTETCLQIDGYVRVTYAYTDPDVGNSVGAFNYRARVNIRANNETDFGTLTSWIRLQGGEGTGLNDANVAVDRALITLAGFRLGYSDTYWATAHNYGFYTDRNDGYYGYDQGTFFDYTYAANGFSATVGVQHSNSFGAGVADARSLDAYAGLTYTGSWGGVAGTIIYDNFVNEFAYKVSADINVIEGLRLRGWYMADDGDTQYVAGNFGGLVSATNRLVDEQYGIAMRYQFTDTLSINAGYTAFDSNVAGLDNEYLTVGLDWQPVPGLSIQPQAVFDDAGEQYNVRVYRTF